MCLIVTSIIFKLSDMVSDSVLPSVCSPVDSTKDFREGTGYRDKVGMERKVVGLVTHLEQKFKWLFLPRVIGLVIQLSEPKVYNCVSVGGRQKKS